MREMMEEHFLLSAIENFATFRYGFTFNLKYFTA